MPNPEEQGEKLTKFCLNHGKLRVEKNGYFKSKSYIFSIDGVDLLKAVSMGMIHTGSFRVSSKDKDALSINLISPISSKSSNNSTFSKQNWNHIGCINSPGILFDRSIVKDVLKNTKAAIIYNNTSRTGDLMNLKVIIPKVYNLSEKHLIKTISKSTFLPLDCCQIIAEFANKFWTENISKKVNSSNCHKLMDNNNKLTETKVMIFRNKLPTWNSQINAYTLEFGGRALVPSVHNFQLINNKKVVVLQLGKINEFGFNVDFSFPLSAYQAFSICLSVIDRTFVWD
eukprot:UN01903